MPVSGFLVGGPAPSLDDERPVPRVDPKRCPGAPRETGLQGQVPIEDQLSGRSKRGYRCGLELVGQQSIRNRGANFQMAWRGDCAYVGMSGQFAQPAPGVPNETQHPLQGVAVIDASNPRKPRLVRILKSSVGLNQHEALEVNQKRGMLVMEIGGVEARYIEIYDVSDDCRAPKFKGRYDSGQSQYHGLRISEDGKTVYASNTVPDAPNRKALNVFDVSNMSKPRLLTTWDPTDEIAEGGPVNDYGVHDLEVNESGTRAYLGALQQVGASPRTTSTVVLDTSDVQKRKPNPDLDVVSETRTQNFSHTVQRATLAGRPSVVSSGEYPFNGAQYCPWAWGNLIDIGNETRPRVVSAIKLQVNERANCSRTGQDDANYSIHYAGVDNPDNTKKLFYTYYMSGLRAFDVRDPKRPRELGYYISPPKPQTVFRPTKPTPPQTGTPQTFNEENERWDQSTSVVRYRRKTGHIWFVSIGNGFQILKATEPGSAVDGRMIVGTSGNDTLRGTAGDDRIKCGAGNDRVDGGGGNDVIDCGSGNDVVAGGSGDDVINGRSGDDRLSGGSGNDQLRGESGDDRIEGGPGRDTASGGSGRDSFSAVEQQRPN